MPIPIGAVMSLITQYTPTGSGTSSVPEAQYIQNVRQQKVDNANYDRQFAFQKSIQDFSQDQKKDTDRRALLSGLQSAIDAGDKTTAAMIVAELEGEHGLTMRERAAVTQAQADLAQDEPQVPDVAPGEPSLKEPETVPGASKAEATAEGPPGWLTDYMAGKRDPAGSMVAAVKGAPVEPSPFADAPDGEQEYLDARAQAELDSAGGLVPLNAPPRMSDMSPIAGGLSPVTRALGRVKTPEAPSAPPAEQAAGTPASEPSSEYDIIDMATGKVRFSGSRKPRMDTEGFYDPAVGAARSEEELRIGAAAQEIARNLAQGGMAPEKAIEVAEQWRTGELNRSAKEAAGGHGRGVGAGGAGLGGLGPRGKPVSGLGFEKGELQEYNAISDRIQRIRGAAARENGIANINAAQRTFHDIEGMASSDASIDQLTAFAARGKALFGAAQSDRERAYLQQAMNPVEDAIEGAKRWLVANRGKQLPPAMRQQLIVTARAAQARLDEYKRMVAQEASGRFTADPAFRSVLERAGMLKDAVEGTYEHFNSGEGAGDALGPSAGASGDAAVDRALDDPDLLDPSEF